MMDDARTRPLWPWLLVSSGSLLNWLQFGPAVAGKIFLGTVFGVVVFFVVPLWLAFVLGQPHSVRRR